MSISPTVNDGTKNLNLHPTAARLLEAGVHQVVSDIHQCTEQIPSICFVLT